METANILEGFEAVDRSVVERMGGQRASRCFSRDLMEAFLASGNECMAKPMESDDLKRAAYNLRKYRKSHADEFDAVGISQRNGRLILFRQ